MNKRMKNIFEHMTSLNTHFIETFAKVADPVGVVREPPLLSITGVKTRAVHELPLQNKATKDYPKHGF